MSNPTPQAKSSLNIRVRTFDRPYRGKRTKAKDHTGALPHAIPFPWQEKKEQP